MLRKLMKHEFKAMGRIMLPVYGAWLLIAVLFGLSLRVNFDDSSANDIIQILIGSLYGMATVAAIVLTLILVILRFHRNMLGNEGYLMFSLPVKTGKHIFNKVFTGGTWTFLGGIVGFLSIILLVMMTEGITPADIIRNIEWDLIEMEGALKGALIIGEFILMIFLSCMEAVTKLYAAISIGHLWDRHRVAGAVLAYIGLSFAETSLLSISENSIEISDLFVNPDRFYGVQVDIMIVCGFILLLMAIYWAMTYFILDRKLNLE